MDVPSLFPSMGFCPTWLDLAFVRVAKQYAQLSLRLLPLRSAAGRAIHPLLNESRAQRPADDFPHSMADAVNGSDDLLQRFRHLVLPELDAAYNFARFLSRDADAAQDIVQNAYLRAFRAFDTYRGGALRAWLLTIVRNCYHDWLRDHRRKSAVEIHAAASDDADDRSDGGIEEIASLDDTPEAALLRKTESQRVRAILNRIAPPLREVLVLREIEGLSYREIAAIAAVPAGTVMSRLARARKEFSEIWQTETDPSRTKS